MLKRRNFNELSSCFVCLEEEETVDHLLIHCSWVSSLWHLSLSLMAVRWVQPCSVEDVLEKTNEDELGWWYLEDDSLGNLVVYMEGKE